MLQLTAGFTQLRTLAFSPDNRHLLAVGLRSRLGGLLRFSRVALWDLSDPTRTVSTAIDDRFDPIAGYFLPDGRLLGIDSQARWRACEVRGGRYRLVESGGHPARLEPMAVSPDGQWFAAIGRDGLVMMPLPENSRPGWSREFENGLEVVEVAFSPASEVVSVVIRDRSGRAASVVAILDADTGAYVRDLPPIPERLSPTGFEDVVMSAWSPQADMLAEIAHEGFLVLDVLTWTPVAIRRLARESITRSLFAPTGGRLVTATTQGLIHFWDQDEWSSPLRVEDIDRPPSQSFDWGIGRIQALAWSSDGSLAAAVGARGDIVVWDM